MKNNKTLHYRSIVQLNYVFCGSDRKLWENAKSTIPAAPGATTNKTCYRNFLKIMIGQFAFSKKCFKAINLAIKLGIVYKTCTN